MSEASVFECSICCCGYGEKTHRPLSLPCGHVFCDQCIQKQARGDDLTCPIDKSKHLVRISALPCCYAILVNLPKERSKEFCCTKHTKKKIKFMCKVHDKCLCTDCIIDHTGSGHLVVAFAATPSKVKAEVEEVVASWGRRSKDLQEGKNCADVMEKRANSQYEVQVMKVNAAYDAAVKALNTHRNEHLTSLKQQFSSQLKSLDHHRSKMQSGLDTAYKQSERMRYLLSTFDKSSYEDIHSALLAASAELKKTDELPQVDTSVLTFKEAIRVTDTSTFCREEEERLGEEEVWQCKLCSRVNQKENKICYNCKTRKLVLRFDMSQAHAQAPAEVMTVIDNLGSMTSRHRSGEGSKTEAELLEIGELKSPRNQATSRGRQASSKAQPVNTPATKRGLGKAGRHASRQRLSGRKRNNSF